MLYERPMHGYEIAKSIEECCEGWCKPTDGMIYPTLKEIVASGYVECESQIIDGRKRKVCSLTEKGHEAYRSAAQVWASVLPYLNASVKEASAIQWTRSAAAATKTKRTTLSTTTNTANTGGIL
jgi:PadR family transcriptional regulator PadR